MGEVYQAHDTKLGRDVAIKVLPEAFAYDPEKLSRFQREAKLLASLNHTNIATIHGLEDSGGTSYLVMELVSGENLAERIQREGAVPVEESLTIAKQIAEALEYAHEHGVIHRDLKPANVKLTPEGKVKVLDFGLAKAFAGDGANEDPSNSPTLSMAATMQGVILGTPAYMSPEQARGKPVDKRTDIWAFGCVLYELLAGQQAFYGKTFPDSLVQILEREPNLEALPPATPDEIRDLVRRCLQKDADLRLRDLGDARIEIEEALTVSREWEQESRPDRQGAVLGSARIGGKAAAVGSLLLILMAVVGLVYWRSRLTAGPARLEYSQLTNFSDSATSPALSPDGRMLTFIRGASTFDGPGQVYVKLLPGGDPVQLTHDDVGKMSPVFSPDGTRIAYTSAGPNWNWDTWVVPTLGGSPSRTLRNASGLTWIDGGDPQPWVLFSTLTGKGLQMAVVTSAESLAQRRDVYVPPETGMAHRSYLSPDHKWILLVEMDINRWLPCRLVPYDGSTKGKPVGPAPAQCTGAAWSSDGRWMYFSANAGNAFHIWRQHFPDGSPEQVTFGATEEEGIALAPDGHSFVTSVGTSQSTVWINDAGGERQLTSEGYGLLPALSFDGRKLYYLERTTGDQHYVSGALWSVDLQSGQREHLLRDYVMQHFSISPDGNQVVFVPIDDAGRSSIWTATLDGRSAPRRLTSKEATRAFFGSGGDVIFMAEEDRANFVYHIKGDGTHLQKVVPVPVLFVYNVSADGKWVAAWVAGTTDDKLNSVAVYPVEGGAPMTICGECASAGGPERGRTPPKVSWSPDMKFVYLSIGGSKTYAFSLRPGQVLPPLPAGGLNSSADLAALPGARLVSERQVFGGPSPSIYTYLQATTHRNIYRIPVP